MTIPGVPVTMLLVIMRQSSEIRLLIAASGTVRLMTSKFRRKLSFKSYTLAAQLIDSMQLSNISLSPSTLDDMDFLFCVYASSRFEEMSLLTGWTDEQKDAFLYGQFLAQHSFYHENYPKARYDIITAIDIKIGRFYVARMKDEIRIMDITLLPPFRNFGVGNLLLTQLMTEAQSNGQFISLHVEESNCAKELYDRMGFVVVRDISFYKLMHWYPLI